MCGKVSMGMPICVAVEGMTDEAVVKRLFDHFQLPLGPVHPTGGKENLRKKISAYNKAAAFYPWFVLVDLNQEAPCAPGLRKQWLPHPNQYMYFRVAVRAVEAWLLADRESLARFLSVPVKKVPTSPDSLENPKATMIQLARQSSRREIQKDMVPTPSGGRKEGPAYASRMIEFVTYYWDIEKAKDHSPSLQRCCDSLKRLSAAIREKD
jgi:hypothetical protein